MHYEIEELELSTKDLPILMVASAPILYLVEEEMELTPLEGAPYAPFLEESLILWAILDEDDDVIFLK